MSASTSPDLAARLAPIVGRSNVSTEAADLSDLARDGLRTGRAALAGAVDATPLAVVRPADTDEVSAVLIAAGELGITVVPYGGGTGLMGGARTIEPGIVLDLRRLDAIIEVQPQDRTARAQAGVVLGNLNAALAPHGLVCGHDPWTVPIATVGGAISTHGLGYLGARYGSIGDQVLGLEVVLAGGAVVRTRPAERSSTGPQLRRLWIGAEGTLGVITEASLRVFPIPEARRIRAVSFTGFSTGYNAICAMAAIGLRPSLLDYGGPSRDAGEARLNLGFEGFREEVEAAERRAIIICHQHGGRTLDDAEARSFFNDRHVDTRRLRSWRAGDQLEAAPGSPGSAVLEYMHMYVPQSRVLEFCLRATDRFEAADAVVTEWGLWHQPELISLVARRSTDRPTDITRMREAHDGVAMLAQDMGGSMEYVHGAGVRLAHLMPRELGSAQIVLARIKGALDPGRVLNPGKLGL